MTNFWRGIVNAVLIWYVLDSALSIATGFWLNIVPNTLLLVLLLVPIVKTRVLSAS